MKRLMQQKVKASSSTFTLFMSDFITSQPENNDIIPQKKKNLQPQCLGNHQFLVVVYAKAFLIIKC